MDINYIKCYNKKQANVTNNSLCPVTINWILIISQVQFRHSLLVVRRINYQEHVFIYSYVINTSCRLNTKTVNCYFEENLKKKFILFSFSVILMLLHLQKKSSPLLNLYMQLSFFVYIFMLQWMLISHLHTLVVHIQIYNCKYSLFYLVSIWLLLLSSFTLTDCWEKIVLFYFFPTHKFINTNRKSTSRWQIKLKKEKSAF